MFQKNTRFTQFLVVLVLSVLVSSCTTLPLAGTPDDALRAGDPERAAHMLEEAAASAASPEREQLLLRAASLHLHLQNLDRAEQLLRQLPATLPAPLQYHRELIEVRRLLLLERPAAAYLAFVTLGRAPEHLRAETLRVHAETAAAVGHLVESAEARVKLEGFLETEEERKQNRQEIWQALSRAPIDVLQSRMPAGRDSFGQWLDLAYSVRTHHFDRDAFEHAVVDWLMRNPSHPAAEELAPGLLTRYREQLLTPSQIALLLPLSGPVGTAGQAVRDGFVAAHYAAPATQRPRLRIYDIGSENSGVLEAYRRAVADGAELVVGPLTKEALSTLSDRGRLQVPTLALNTLPDNRSAAHQLFQFGLSPEDEAAAAARYAIAKGFANALVLVPDSEWGSRIAEAFSTAFHGDYQKVLKVSRYESGGTDFSKPIRSLLNLDASEQRADRLRNALNLGFEFEATRRHDVDVIFIAANPRDARLIRPQLRYYQAIGLPVIGTSHLYTGTPNKASDQDMEGIVFVDMPWLLRSEQSDSELSRARLQRIWPGVQRLPRLYALGIDAYQLVPFLETLRENPGDGIDGKTGVLTIDSSGRVHRNLIPARFVRGEPQVETPEAADVEGRVR